MSDLGRYRIQTVAEMTGVSAATLRQWERRYGVPSPDRTASSYRIYGQPHLDQIRRMVQLGEQGIAPSEAARIVRDEGETRRAPSDPPADTGETLLGELDPYLEARRGILEAVERYDFDRLSALARKLLYLGSAVTIFERVVAPAMREIGRRWHDGGISVAQEHMASEIIGRLLHQLLPLVQPTTSERLAVLACFGEDTHTLPLYGVGFRVAQWGYRSLVLGARTPPTAIAATVRNLRPTVIGLSVTVAPAELDGARLAQAYGEAAGDVPWVVGGRGVRSMAEQIQEAGGFIAPTDAAGLEALMRRLADQRVGARSG